LRARRDDKKEKYRDYNRISAQRLEKDQDKLKLQLLIETLTSKYNIDPKELLLEVEKDSLIPTSIFSEKLSTLETVVKYLKENNGLKNKKIAELVGRDSKSVWQAYNSSKKKQAEKIIVSDIKHTFPISILKNKQLSVLENVVAYLKEQGLQNKEISELIKRDQRTIWTVLNRAKNKRGGNENIR